MVRGLRVVFSPNPASRVLYSYRVPEPGSFQRTGSGLGLVIAKQIVQQHGGQLAIQSQPGEGTTVFFDLSIYNSGQAGP